MNDPEMSVDVLAMRSNPKLIVLDDSLRIIFADWTAMLTLLPLAQNAEEPMQVLPSPLHEAVLEAVAGWGTKRAAECVVEPLPDVVLRISRLSGVSNSYVAVFCESRIRRDDVKHAVAAYSLTRRERDVLTLVLRGFSSSEIAEELVISEATVGDYFKQLLRKTRSKNRTEMIARVLGWTVSPSTRRQMIVD